MVHLGRALAGALGLLVALLAGLDALLGLAPASWALGLTSGILVVTAVARTAADRLGPADVVTLARATLACAVAALVVESSLGGPVTPALVALAALALALDAVDGRVARTTGTRSAYGGRFDGEADAFLLLVLGVHVAQSYGAWVLAIGLARYAFWAAGWALPWFRRRLPPRPWCRVVAGVQGVVLVVAAAHVLPAAATYAALLLALGLLTESFGRDVLWLVRHRHEPLVDLPARVGAGRQPAP